MSVSDERDDTMSHRRAVCYFYISTVSRRVTAERGANMVLQTMMWGSTVGMCQQSRRDYSRTDRISHGRSMPPAWRQWMLLLGTFGLWLGGCSSDLIPHVATHPMTLSTPEGWHDGTYTGTSDTGDLPTPQLVRVTMDVSRGQVVSVRVHQPPGWNAPREEDLILRRALEQPSPGLETSSPAGSETDQLLHALDDAITRARTFTPASP